MKRYIGISMLALLLSANSPSMIAVFGQESAPAINLSDSTASDPQFALALLDDYFKKSEISRRKIGVALTAAGGGLFVLGAAATSYAFLAPDDTFSSKDEQNLVRGITAGSAGLGVLMGGVGLITLAQPKDKYLQQYAYLYKETDPVVQEALAYGIIKDLADDAERNRIINGIIGITSPLALVGAQAIIAAGNNDWGDFKKDSLSSLGWALPNFVSGLVMLIGGTSTEERLLETYRSTNGAYVYTKK